MYSLHVCEPPIKMSNNTTGLPSTELSTFLDDRVNRLTSKVGSAEVGEVTIRVVSSSHKTLKTHSLMKDRYSQLFPEQFPYQTKTLFAFEVIDGVDVCFFGMYMQEYGSECPAPNNR